MNHGLIFSKTNRFIFFFVLVTITAVLETTLNVFATLQMSFSYRFYCVTFVLDPDFYLQSENLSQINYYIYEL